MATGNYRLDRPINIVVIGSGKAGTYHLDTFKYIDNANVIGIMNSGRKDPIELRRKHNIKHWVKNFEDLKNLKNIEAVFIAVTSQKTVEIVEKISSLGIACLIEKPLGVSPVESSKICSLLKKTNGIYYVGFNRRFYSSFIEAQKYVYKLGFPFSIHVDSPEPHSSLLMRGKKIEDVTNRLLLNTTHSLDFFTLFFGESRLIKNFNNNACRNGYKTDYMSFLQFDNNNTGSFISHWSSAGQWQLKIFGEDYQIVINLTKNEGELFSLEFGNQKFKLSKDDIICKPGVLKQNYYFLKSVIDKKKSHQNLCELKEAHINNDLAYKLGEF